MAYKLIGDEFEIWMRKKIDERNEKLAKDKDLMISVDPEIARVFNNSNFVSCKYIK